jgi:transposase
MTHKLTDIEKGRMVERIDNGMTYREAGREFGIDHKTTARLYRTVKSIGNIRRKVGSGPQRKWSERESRIAKKLIHTGKANTAVDVRRILEGDYKKKLSVETVRRILRSHGLNGRIRIKKPLLTARHKKLRLKFAKKYRKWKKEDWRKVMFTDETKINRFGSDGKLYCWRKKNEPMSDRTTKPSVKGGGGGFMVWSCFGYNGVGWATKITGTMNQTLYKDVLEDEMKGSIEYCIPGQHQDDFIFAQDNAPCHKAESIMKWFQGEGITLLEHPPQSPDLNPIENLWRIIKHKLYNNVNIRSVEYLWKEFEKEWEHIGKDICQKLIDSMPERLDAVIKAKGGHTKY